MVVAVINQKGGVGKTTTSNALGAGFNKRGKKVLLIDLDPQRNLTNIMRADTKGITVLDVLLRRATADQATQVCPSGEAIIAASEGLAADGILTMTGKEYRLREALEGLKTAYDYIIVDCPPTLGTLTINALTAADYCVIPAQADSFSMDAIDEFMPTLEVIKRYTNPGIKILGVVITRYDKRAILSRDMIDNITAQAEKAGAKVLGVVREGIAVKEAQAVKQDLFTYAPSSNAARDYSAVIDEIERSI